MFAPAMIDRTSASARMPFSPFITSLSRCGLTESTTTSACEAAAELSVVNLMSYFFVNSAPRSLRGPAAVTLSGLASFLRNKPAIMASAITPGPTNAILFFNISASMELSYSRLPNHYHYKQNERTNRPLTLVTQSWSLINYYVYAISLTRCLFTFFNSLAAIRLSRLFCAARMINFMNL
jgi:hypothetical protein